VESRFSKTEAIVLSSVRFGDGHKIINLFTEKFGKIEASAFGVRKTKSRFGGKLEPFTISYLVLYHKNEESPFSIREADVLFQDSGFSGEYRRYAVACSLVEPVLLFVPQGQVEDGLYRLLSDSIRVLCETPPEKSLYLLTMYDVQFLKLMGYAPDSYQCKKCGGKVSENAVGLDGYFGFPLCGDCMTRGGTAVCSGALRFIRWACDDPSSRPIALSRKVSMEESTLRNLRVVIEQLYLHTFHRKPQSWNQLHAFH
jgi:DNA repair protein RecO (recombination protein O)